MSLEVIIGEIKEFACECVQKNGMECITAPDSVIIAYLKTSMYDKDFEIFVKHKDIMLRIFRETAKEELYWLKS
jgi:hypothetical protein